MRYVPRSPREGINVSDTHPLSEAATLIAGLGLLFVLLTLLIVFLVEIAILFISPETEARLFSGISPPDLSAVEDDAGRQQRLQALLDRLASHWPDAPYAFRVEISESDEPNAFAFPGGLVIVTSALLDQASSENEVAFVLAHELGHFHNRDHLRLLGRTAVLGLVFAVMSGNTSGAGLSTRIADLTTRHFSRKQEKRADEFGVGLVFAEYGHIAEAWRFFERVTDADKGARWLAYISTHPASESRIEQVKAFALERGWAGEGPTTQLDW